MSAVLSAHPVLPAARLSLRRATEADAADLAGLIDLSNAGGDRHDMAQAIANVLRRDSDVSFTNAIIAEIAGRIAGGLIINRIGAISANALASVAPEHRPFELLKSQVPGAVYVRNIAVDDRYRGLGCGRMLMQTAINLAEATRSRCAAIIRADNEAMANLLAASGFRLISVDRIVEHATLTAGTRILLWATPAFVE